MKNFILVLLMVVLGQQTVIAQKTVRVFIVRHAEKLTVDANEKDPELSPEGAERATALLKELKGDDIDTIYTTNYKRTKLTAFPLADKLGLTIHTYNAAEQKDLVERIVKYGAGKNFLIVGHSNTVLDLVTSFGIVKPVKELTDADYDYLFEVTVKGKKADVKVGRYGKAHHSSGKNDKEMKTPN